MFWIVSLHYPYSAIPLSTFLLYLVVNENSIFFLPPLLFYSFNSVAELFLFRRTNIYLVFFSITMTHGPAFSWTVTSNVYYILSFGLRSSFYLLWATLIVSYCVSCKINQRSVKMQRSPPMKLFWDRGHILAVVHVSKMFLEENSFYFETYSSPRLADCTWCYQD